MKKRRTRPTAMAAALLVLSASAACDDPAGLNQIQLAELVGSYAATTLTTTVGGEATDRLAEGVILTIDLNSDGTTMGRLFIPEGSEDGSDLETSLDGSWTFDDDQDLVHFDHPADTFLRDITFEAVEEDGNFRLQGEGSFVDESIQIVLEQQ